jgi:hypothetical protein
MKLSIPIFNIALLFLSEIIENSEPMPNFIFFGNVLIILMIISVEKEKIKSFTYYYVYIFIVIYNRFSRNILISIYCFIKKHKIFCIKIKIPHFFVVYHFVFLSIYINEKF